MRVRPPVVPPAPATIDLDKPLELLAALAKVPDVEVRVKLFLLMTGRSPDDPFVAVVRQVRLDGDRRDEFEVLVTKEEAARLDRQGALRLLQVSASMSGRPCRGDLRFAVRDGVLRCANGVPLAAIEAASAGGALEGHKLLVMHSTLSGGDLGRMARFFTTPELNASSHVLVAEDGAVVQLVSLDRAAYHAGAGTWHDLRRLNYWSVGLSLMNVGKVDGTWAPFPQAQLDVTKAVARAIVEAYDIPEIVGHCHIDPKRRADPGPLFPFEDFQKSIYGRTSPLAACGE